MEEDDCPSPSKKTGHQPGDLFNADLKANEKRIESLEKTLDELEQELKELHNKFEAGTLTENRYDKLVANKKDEIASKSRQLEVNKREQELKELTQELKELEEELKELDKKFEAGILTENRYDKLVEAKKDRIASKKDQIASLKLDIEKIIDRSMDLIGGVQLQRNQGTKRTFTKYTESNYYSMDNWGDPKNPEVTIRFLNQIMEADLEPIEDPTILESEEQRGNPCDKKETGYYLLKLDDPPNERTPATLYIRKEMMDIIGEIKEQIQKKKRQILITGTPGMGKTTTALVALNVLRKENPEHYFVLQRFETWLIIQPNGDIRILCNKTEVVTGVNNVLERGGKVFNFIDPFSAGPMITPMVGDYVSIGWISPKRANLMGDSHRDVNDYFGKGKSIFLCMKNWKPVEILDLRRRCYSRISEEEVKRKMQIWGLVLRPLFEVNYKLEHVISATREGDIINFFNSIHMRDGHPSSITKGQLVHIKPGEDRSSFIFFLASRKITKCLVEKNKKALLGFAWNRVRLAARGAESTQGSADWLEIVTRHHFCEDSPTFSPTPLERPYDKKSGQQLEIKMNDFRHKFFNEKDFKDCEFEDRTYYEPSWRTLQSIDSLFVWNGYLVLIQITFNKDHGLKSAGVKRAWRQARNTRQNLKGFILLFVFPSGDVRKGEKHSGAFKYQKYTTSRKETDENSERSDQEILRNEIGQYLYVLPDFPCGGACSNP